MKKGDNIGVKDRNGKDIMFGDIVRFADKVDWYRHEYKIDVLIGKISGKEALAKIDAMPYEERVLDDFPMFYEWLLSEELQEYWEVVGNKFNNPAMAEIIKNRNEKQ